MYTKCTYMLIPSDWPGQEVHVQWPGDEVHIQWPGEEVYGFIHYSLPLRLQGEDEAAAHQQWGVPHEAQVLPQLQEGCGQAKH